MKCGRNNPAMWAVLGRVASCSAIAALLLNPALSPAIAADSESQLAPMATAASKMRFLALGVGKSVVIDLSRHVKDVLVADPKIANAVVRSSQRA